MDNAGGQWTMDETYCSMGNLGQQWTILVENGQYSWTVDNADGQ